MTWLVCVGLFSIRMSVALALSPALSAYGVPAVARIALTLALAALVFAGREPDAAVEAMMSEPAMLLRAMFAEVLIGALLGVGVHLLLAALALAGRLLDVQIGFAIGAIFDPVTRSASNVLGSMAVLAGLALFFANDAHIELVRILAQSLEVFPLGALPSAEAPLQPVLGAGSMFALGLAFAAPVVVALLLTDVMVAVASRNMPQVNVLILAMPLKVLVGYFVLALTVPAWGPLMRDALGSALSAIEGRQ